MKLLNVATSWPPWAAHSVQGDEEGARGLLKNLLVLGFHTGSKEQAGGFYKLPQGLLHGKEDLGREEQVGRSLPHFSPELLHSPCFYIGVLHKVLF